MGAAAKRGVSLSLVIGFLAPLCIVIEPEVPLVPTASAATAGDNITITGPIPVTPTGSTISDVEATFTDDVKSAAEALWPGATFPAYTIAIANLAGDAGATTAVT